MACRLPPILPTSAEYGETVLVGPRESILCGISHCDMCTDIEKFGDAEMGLKKLPSIYHNRYFFTLYCSLHHPTNKKRDNKQQTRSKGNTHLTDTE